MIDRHVAVALALAALSFAAPAAEAAGVCTPNKTVFITNPGTDYAYTVSTDFERMPGMRRLITTTVRGCVIVDFSGNLTSLVNTDQALLRVAIVGQNTVAEPPSVETGFASNQSYHLRSMRFIFPSLAAGTYDIRVEWLTVGGNEARVKARTMTVQYR